MPTDLLANVERPLADRPRPVAPLVPDLVPPERPWLGSATGEVLRWKQRALVAEAELAAARASNSVVQGILRTTGDDARVIEELADAGA